MQRIFSTLFALSLGAVLTLPMAAQNNQNATNSDRATSSQGSSQPSTTQTSDHSFMKKAAEGGMAEVEMGQLATQKASSEDVKKFGQRMVDDHTKANEELKKVAAEENVNLPQGLSMKDKATKARLEKLSGEQFDQAYMKDMVKDHQKDVSDFEKESKSGSDPKVKEFAEKTLPTLREHLQKAQQISPKEQTSSAR